MTITEVQSMFLTPREVTARLLILARDNEGENTRLRIAKMIAKHRIIGYPPGAQDAISLGCKVVNYSFQHGLGPHPRGTTVTPIHYLNCRFVNPEGNVNEALK